MERQPQVFEFGPFQLDVGERLLRRDGESLALTPKAFDTLLVLMENHGRLVGKDDLMKRLWPESFVEESNVAQQIFTLRKALGDDKTGSQYIETVPKRGYRFCAPVRLLTPAAPAPEPVPTAAPGPTGVPVTVPQDPRLAGPVPESSFRPIRFAWVVLAAGLSLVLYSGWRASRPGAAPAPSKMTLAVLPFQNLSGDEDQEYLSDGMTEEMIMHLAQLNPARLAVIARTSSMHFKGSRRTVAQIGQELAADYVLQGSLRREGDRLRISAQLIQVEDQTHLWARNYERNVDDLLAVQDDVARAIASEIRVQLTPPPLSTAGGDTRPGSVAPAVHQQYLKGRYFWNKRTEAGYVKAIENFQLAIRSNPDYAPPYAGLADAYALLGSMSNSTSPRLEAMPRARSFAEKALALDESLAEAHASLAFVLMHFDHDWAAAEKEFQRAIALNPSYVTAHHWYAYCLMAQTRLDEALREIRLAQELDPLSLIINTDVAELLYYARRHDEAIRQAQKTLEMDSSFALAHRVLGLAYEQKGMYKESVAELETQVRLGGRADYALAELARAYALTGNRDEAEKLLRELLALNPQNPGTSIGLAFLYAALGDKDQAFLWLEKSARERMGIIMIKVQPYFDSLRSDPRFLAIERRMALPHERASSK
jgi:TolB-like protein/DNA-binding winged helix-turn-helix (wHTH) protein/Tfp pilus assembly protein PilF